MITCYVDYGYMDDYSLIIPYEINNQFWGPVFSAMMQRKMKKYGFKIIYKDFGGEIKISVDELDEHLKFYEILEENLDEIIEIIPLPKKIGTFDGYYELGFISSPCSPENPDKNEIHGEKEFTKEDMFLLIDLIKKKILEAKERNLPLIFSGD